MRRVRGRNGQRRADDSRAAAERAAPRARARDRRAREPSIAHFQRKRNQIRIRLLHSTHTRTRWRSESESLLAPAGGGTAAGPARRTAYDDAQTRPVTHKMPQRHQPVYIMTEREPRANRNPHRPTPQRASATRSRPRSGIRIRCAQTDTIALVAPARRAPRQHRRGHSPAHTFTQTHAQMQLYLRRWLVATCAARIACHRTNMFFTLYIHAL